MLGKSFFFTGSLLLPLALGLAGCARSAPSSIPQQGVQHADHDHVGHEHADHDHADHHEGSPAQQGAQDPAVTAALAELSPADKSLAENQRICPVSGELLGSMGAPIKVEVLGQQVFICCAGCKTELLEKPEEFLAKLNK